MDDRVRRHAGILTDYCTDVSADDDVLIRAPTPAADLVEALYERIGDRGARPTTEWRHPRATRAYGRAIDPDDVRTADHRLAAMAETDVVILIKGAENDAAGSDVDPETRAALRRAKRPVLDERLETRWVITQYPTAADAQRADLPTRAWEEFVYDAVDRDWDAQRAFQERLVDVLEPAETVRIVSGDDTDLRLSVDGMGAFNDAGEDNMPGGEVATVPVVDSADGTITFDLPVVRGGREIRGARLTFEDGEVVDHAAERNEAALTALLDTDDGARRLGELGIGMNRDIDRFTNNLLFDEKMGDTVHVALGDAMAECVPDDRELNESAVHADLLVDTSEDSRIEVDGEVVQENGTFAFE
ncbi:aminopeptidase [Halosimplex halobium]|uniref:aminopeptidase n=1 Tax=Halosimplex halobium TaxID=3396618 RepID=UPI003F558088